MARPFFPPLRARSGAVDGAAGDFGDLVAGDAEILQRFEDYSGAFVLHCHFLGHEDRGMMFNVQTTCPEKDNFGTPQEDGRADDCRVPAEIEPNPFPQCKSYG